MSFQHFRGEELYSDIIVKPENNMCETEDVECYPIPDHVPQNGRSEGYYPDSTIVYIRILWKEFEPKRGEYNYQLIEDVISKAKAHLQSLIFRLLPHSTRACDDVPDWLKEMIDCPERPNGKRVKKSPTDPLFIKLFCEAIKKIGDKFDSDPVFESIDISLPGAWGEGSNLEAYSEEDIYGILDTYIESFKNTQLISQYCLTDFLNYTRKRANIGWRADGLGDPNHMNNIYPPKVALISDFWETAPVSFEAYWWMSEWKRQGWSIDELIKKTLEWHITSFNPKSIPIPYEWEEKVEYWLSKMGYHYSIESFSFPKTAYSGDTVEFTLNIDNVGVAPCYHSIPLYIKLKGKNEYVFETEVDIKKWMPGKYSENIVISLPKNIESDNYSIEVSIFDDIVKNVFFATDADFDGRWYGVGSMCIENK